MYKYVENISSYLQGRKMADRKKEEAERWIVGYVLTSQWPVAVQRTLKKHIRHNVTNE